MQNGSPEIYAFACFINLEAFSYFWSLNLDNLSPSSFSLYEDNSWILDIPFALSNKAVLDPIPSISERYPFLLLLCYKNFAMNK